MPLFKYTVPAASLKKQQGRCAFLLFVSCIVLLLVLLDHLASCQEDSNTQQYGNQLSYQVENDLQESSGPPRIEIIKHTKIKMQNEANDENNDSTTSSSSYVIDFWDAENIQSVASTVPLFFENLPEERVLQELDYHHFVKKGKGWSERVLLEWFYYALVYGTDHKPPSAPDDMTTQQHYMLMHGNWFNDDVSVCMWYGITCGTGMTTSNTETTMDKNNNANKQNNDCDYCSKQADETNFPAPKNRVTKIDLPEGRHEGTLLSELYQLEYLYRLNLNDNRIQGSIPTTFGLFERLTFLDLGVNLLEGSIPTELALLNNTLDELWFERNYISAPTFPKHLMALTLLEFLDISGNYIGGPLATELGLLTKLESLFLEENQITGTIVTEMGCLTNMKVLDLGFNRLSGTLPTEIGKCTSLNDFNVVAQKNLGGILPTDLWRLTGLENFLLSQNNFTGPLPSTMKETYISSEPDEDASLEMINVWGWSRMERLATLAIDRNRLNGSIPADLFLGIGPSLTALDLGFNQLTGTLPTELGVLTLLERITAPSNKLRGSLPQEFGNLVVELAQINLTSNFFTGSVPKALCDVTHFDSLLVKEFGCDAILCPPGTFHPDGAASLYGGCRPCPSLSDEVVEEGIPPLSEVLGLKRCEGEPWRVGDLDADGIVSTREALRVLYIETSGEWGGDFHVWHQPSVPECDLPGVRCVDSEVVKIDLTDAGLCSDNGEELTEGQCSGLPAELGLLSSLEVLVLSNQKFLAGSIPTEIGKLSNLKLLDISNCPRLRGPIPSELGLLTNLRVLNLNSCSLNSTLPDELFTLPNLEKINLSANSFSGKLPTTMGMMGNIREMLLSRSYLTGMIPEEIGYLSTLENLELYSNQLSGQMPDTMGHCERLKRIDFFNNNFNGTIPPSLGRIAMLQILHLKKNALTGKIPGSIGSLPYLSWLDASSNYLEGTLPVSFGASRNLKDLRLGSNRLHDPLPTPLCSNLRVNGGHTKMYGCDAILCPLGTYSETGYASDGLECKECPQGETTMYLGSTSCLELSEKDILSMLYVVMRGEQWPEQHQKGWKDSKSDLHPCEWSGISCDENGDIKSLSFPVSSTNDAP